MIVIPIIFYLFHLRFLVKLLKTTINHCLWSIIPYKLFFYFYKLWYWLSTFYLSLKRINISISLLLLFLCNSLRKKINSYLSYLLWYKRKWPFECISIFINSWIFELIKKRFFVIEFILLKIYLVLLHFYNSSKILVLFSIKRCRKNSYNQR